MLIVTSTRGKSNKYECRALYKRSIGGGFRGLRCRIHHIFFLHFVLHGSTTAALVYKIRSNMSSLTRFTPLTSRLAAPVRTATPAFGVAVSRSLSSTTRKEKGAVDATKDTLKKVDRTVSDATLKGIETGGMSISFLLVLWIGN